MRPPSTEPEGAPTIADLYPHYTPAEQAEAAENLQRYVEVCARILERLEANPVAYARFRALTGDEEAATVDNATTTKPLPHQPA